MDWLRSGTFCLIRGVVMPNPRYFIDGEHQYVGGYVRRRKTRGSASCWTFFAIVFCAGVAAWFLYRYWPWVVGTAVVVLVIFVAVNWKRWRHNFLLRRLHRSEERYRRDCEAREARSRLSELQRGQGGRCSDRGSRACGHRRGLPAGGPAPLTSAKRRIRWNVGCMKGGSSSSRRAGAPFDHHRRRSIEDRPASPEARDTRPARARSPSC